MHMHFGPFFSWQLALQVFSCFPFACSLGNTVQALFYLNQNSLSVRLFVQLFLATFSAFYLHLYFLQFLSLFCSSFEISTQRTCSTWRNHGTNIAQICLLISSRTSIAFSLVLFMVFFVGCVDTSVLLCFVLLFFAIVLASFAMLPAPQLGQFCFSFLELCFAAFSSFLRWCFVLLFIVLSILSIVRFVMLLVVLLDVDFIAFLITSLVIYFIALASGLLLVFWVWFIFVYISLFNALFMFLRCKFSIELVSHFVEHFFLLLCFFLTRVSLVRSVSFLVLHFSLFVPPFKLCSFTMFHWAFCCAFHWGSWRLLWCVFFTCCWAFQFSIFCFCISSLVMHSFTYSMSFFISFLVFSLLFLPWCILLHYLWCHFRSSLWSILWIGATLRWQCNMMDLIWFMIVKLVGNIMHIWYRSQVMQFPKFICSAIRWELQEHLKSNRCLTKTFWP